jgi:hypothetical protein
MGDEEQNDHDHGHRDNGDRDFRPHRNPYNGPPRMWRKCVTRTRTKNPHTPKYVYVYKHTINTQIYTILVLHF